MSASLHVCFSCCVLFCTHSRIYGRRAAVVPLVNLGGRAAFRSCDTRPSQRNGNGSGNRSPNKNTCESVWVIVWVGGSVSINWWLSLLVWRPRPGITGMQRFHEWCTHTDRRTDPTPSTTRPRRCSLSGWLPPQNVPTIAIQTGRVSE